MGGLRAVQQVIPDMIERKQGTIFFTNGGLALNPIPAQSLSAIGKAGLQNLAFAMGDELAFHGIFVGTVIIGGAVKEGTFFHLEAIAAVYWDLYTNQNKKKYSLWNQKNRLFLSM